MSVDIGAVGVWLLVFSAVAIVVEGAVAAIWSRRIAIGATTLSRRLATEQVQIRADLERLRAALAETQVLWEPYAGLLRWLRHPIAIALMQSLARRRAAAR